MISEISFSQETALETARRICKEEGWEWKDVHVEETNSDGRDIYFIRTNVSQLGQNAFIQIDKNTGVVIKAEFNPR